MKNNYEKLVDPNKHQVFIMRCPAGIPINFASHTWLVCNEKGEISRWEVLIVANKDKTWGHLYLNQHPPFRGIEIFFHSRFHWNSKLLKQIEGELAEKMIDFIKKSKENYPFKEYSLIGTNCNTYTKWVLNNFPEAGTKLPWNCFGKNAK